MNTIYTNQVNVGVAEMARLDCCETFNGVSSVVVRVVMPIEVMRNLSNVIKQVIAQYDEGIEKQKEANKKLS